MQRRQDVYMIPRSLHPHLSHSVCVGEADPAPIARLDGRSFLHAVCRADPADAAGVSAISRRSSICRTRKWFVPPHGRRRRPIYRCGFTIAWPAIRVGPASGPQTQMAQNLVLSWLAGGADHGAQNGPGQRRAEDFAARASTRPTSATTSSGRRSCASPIRSTSTCKARC